MLLALGLNPLDYVVLLAYLATVLMIGFWFHSHETDTESFLLGGRRMPWWAVGVSYTVTFLSAISLVGVPGEAYKNGVTAAVWPLLGLSFSIVFFFIFIRFYFQGPLFTPFEYLERRFGSVTRGVTAGIYCLARLLYLGAVLYATAKVFQGMVQWPLIGTIVMIGAITMIYTTLGGIQAVVWIDMMQFLVLIGALGTVIWVSIANLPGGVLDVFRFAQQTNHLFPDFARPEFYSLSPFVRLTLWTMIIRAVGDHLFYKSADQLLIQRMLSTSSYQHAFRCTLLGSGLAATMVLSLYFVGLCVYQYYSGFPLEQRPPADLALFQFIATHLPTPLPGLVVAAVLAAGMSTIDSAANSLSTVFTKDFYLRFWNPHASEADQIKVSRRMTAGWGLLIVSVAILITVLAEGTDGTVLESAGIWMSLLLVLAPVFLLGVVSRKARQHHALISLAIGIVTTFGMIAWYYRMRSSGVEVGFHMVAVTGFLSAIMTGFGLSRFAPRLTDQRLVDLTLWTLGRPSRARLPPQTTETASPTSSPPLVSTVSQD